MAVTYRPRTALVLSGGGSRGAYEAGILRYVRKDLARQLGGQLPIDIVTGTSVGAINGCFVAATQDDPARQADILCDAWRSLRIESLISLKAGDVLRAGRLLLGAVPPAPKPGAYRYGGVLDTTGLERFVVRTIPWRGIRRNLAEHRLLSLAVSATQVGSGHTMVFIDTAEGMPRSRSRNILVQHRSAAIGPRHALASAAIPLLFPAVRVGQRFYVDGGLRQNTPMSPAIRLGADRLLIVSLRHAGAYEAAPEIEDEREIAYPKPLFLAGKALNAMLLDHTDYDLDRMRRLNAIMDAGTRAFGSDFLPIINRELSGIRGAPLRNIQAVHIRPSQDIGAIASDFLHNGKVNLRGRVAKRLVARLVRSEAAHENDLLSYLLFDGEFADALIQLGYHDAAAHEEQLARLFSFDGTNRKPRPHT